MLTVVAIVVVFFVMLGGGIWLSIRDEGERANTTPHEQTYVPPVPVQVPGVGWVMIG